MTMKALVSHGPLQMAYEDWAEPDLPPGHVLVEVDSCGICGSDLHPYRGMPSRRPNPGVWGHEFSGTVVAAGIGADATLVGSTVAVQPLISCGRCPQCQAGHTNVCANAVLIGGPLPGGFAQRVVVPERNAFVLPAGLGLATASLAETLATPVHVFENNVRGLLRSVLVIGAGPQGLLCTQLARLVGAPLIVVADVMPARLDMARQMGATHIVNSREADALETVHELTAGQGVDLVIEAAGQSASRQQAIAAARRAGTVVFLATGREATPIDFTGFVPREVHLRGTQCYTDADFSLALALLASGEVEVASMVTELPLSQGAEAFDRLVNDPGALIKVTLRA